MEFKNRITMRKLKGDELLNFYHDKYAKYYNANHIRALADYRSISESLDERFTEKKEELSKTVSMLNFTFTELTITADEDSDEARLSNELYNLSKEIFNPNRLHVERDKEKDIQEMFEIMAGIFEAIGENFTGDGMDYVDEAYGHYEDLRRIDINRLALKHVNDLVLDNGYPEPLKLIGEMTETEQARFKKETLSSFDLQENDYWETAYSIYDKDDSKTWRDVWKEIEEMRDENGLVQRYSTFPSFKRNKNKYDTKRKSERK